jgi:hypothetical protein
MRFAKDDALLVMLGLTATSGFVHGVLSPEPEGFYRPMPGPILQIRTQLPQSESSTQAGSAFQLYIRLLEYSGQ